MKGNRKYIEYSIVAIVTSLCWLIAYVDKPIERKIEVIEVTKILPILVKDSNRILGEQRYDLSDRTDRRKSIEMFHIIMDHYNPTYDINLAAKIWNPKSKLAYHRKVENEYYKLLNME